jgi:H+/Cl- antiporter ClcA
VAGLGIALLAILYGEATDKNPTEVLFSGQSALPTLINQHASYAIGALLLLMVCKSLGYAISLSSFRGGPVFPAMFIGGAAGVAMAGLPGMNLIPAVGMGIGAMSAVMLRLPLTSVLLATLLLGADGLAAMPVVIVAVVVSFVVSAWLPPARPKDDDGEADAAPAASAAAPARPADAPD